MTVQRIAWGLGVVSFLLYLGLAALRPQGVFWSLDEGGKFIYLENVLRTGDVRAPLLYPAQPVDPQAEAIPLFFVVRDGAALYSWWPVAFPLLTLPGYVAFGWLGLYLLPAAAGAGSVALSVLIVHQLAPRATRAGLLTGVVLAVSTPLLYYSATYWEHSLCAFGLLLAAWAILQDEAQPDWRWRALAAGGAAFAVWLRVDQAVMWAGLLGGWAIWRWRAGRSAWPPVQTGLLSGLGMLTWLAFNMWAMGAPFTRQAESLGERGWFQGFGEAGWQFLAYPLIASPRVLAWTPSDSVLAVGVVGVILSLAPLGISVWPRVPRRALSAAALLGYGLIAALSGRLLFEPEGYRSIHSLVLIAPVVVLAAWALGAGDDRTRGWGWMTFGALTAYLVAYYARGWIAAGGLQWGPRYMLSLYPLLATAAGAGLIQLWPSASRRLKTGLVLSVLILTGLGLGFQVRGVAASAQTVNGFARASAALHEDVLTTDLILTPCTWFAMVVPDWYWNGRLLTDAYSGTAPYVTVRINMCEDIALDQVTVLEELYPDGIRIGP